MDQDGTQSTVTPSANIPVKSLRIPSPPAALARVIQAASDPKVPVPELGKLVTSDPGFAVQLLQLVNSSLYSRGARITSVERAVAVLGSRSLRNLALCVAVRNCVDPRALGDFELRRFWEDSLRRAVAARILAEGRNLDPMEAFTVGLIQDLGLLALVQTHPEHAAAWMSQAGCDAEARREQERATFGCRHDDVARPIVDTWQLPAELAIPICHHHCPSSAPSHRAQCALAQDAETLAGVLADDDKRAALDAARGALAASGVTGSAFEQLVGVLGERVSQVAGELGLRVGAQPGLEEILTAANTGLVEMNLSYEELVVQLERTIEEKEALAAELAQRNRELEQLSLTDGLTGCPNRRAFSGRLAYEISRTARTGEPLVLILGDIDHFKRVNDTWGHEFGDVVLKGVSDCLTDAVRGTDMVARIGGEEFAVLLPSTPTGGGIIAAKKLLNAVSSVRYPAPDGTEQSFSISLGLCTLEGQVREPVNADEVSLRMYKSSDAALYASKRGGRNRVTRAEGTVAWFRAAAAA